MTELNRLKTALTLAISIKDYSMMIVLGKEIKRLEVNKRNDM